MCYPSIAEIEKGKDGKTPLKLPAGYLSRTGYRLPTEAEWEYACRAGSVTSWYYGSSEELLRRHAWYRNNAEDRTWPVGQKKPNGFGLFDMHGNINDWCQSSYAAYKPGPAGKAIDDKEYDNSSFILVLRGGSFGGAPVDVRSADRLVFAPANRVYNVGLRVARTLP